NRRKTLTPTLSRSTGIGRRRRRGRRGRMRAQPSRNLLKPNDRPRNVTAPSPPIEFPAPPQRVLVIKPSAIGDVVHALPALNLLRRRWPQARLSWLITPACAGILEGHPQVDELIPFQRNQFARFWRSPGALADIFGL